MIDGLLAGLPAALQLAGKLAWLSLFSIGGAHVVLPDVYRFIVDDRGYFTGATFASLVALSQAAPGPNMLVFAMFGYQLGGVGAAAVDTLAFCVIPFMVSYGVARAAKAAAEGRWSKIVQTGLAPLTVGVILASGMVLAQGPVRAAPDDLHAGLAVAIVAATAIIASLTKWHPLWLIIAGALIAMVV